MALALFPLVAFGQEDGWVSLFDGKTLDGWKSNDEVANVFSVTDGALKVKGGRAHLFYEGDVNGGTFKNFEFRAKVKTTAGSNSGIYFHTEFQGSGWPLKGYECQVNTSYSDRRKSGSLYGIKDILDKSPTADDEWVQFHIKVSGSVVTVSIEGRQVVEYDESKDRTAKKRIKAFRGRLLSEGTFAIQGHDEHSVTYFKDIQVKVLGK